MSQRNNSYWRRVCWPNIYDQDSAAKAAKTAASMAFLVSGTTAFLWILSRLGVFNVSGTVLIDAIVFAVIGIGLRHMWRSASVIGLLLHLIKVVNSVVHAPGLVVVSVLTTLVFANGIRGAVAYRRFTTSF